MHTETSNDPHEIALRPTVELLRPEDIAASLQISRSKVYDLMRDGSLRSVRLGGSRRVTLKALADFVARLDEEAA